MTGILQKKLALLRVHVITNNLYYEEMYINNSHIHIDDHFLHFSEFK